MVVNSIKVFARLKKEHKLKEKWYDIERKTPKYDDLIFLKESAEDKYASSKFRFYQVFDQEAKQDLIFETVAKPVVNSVLQGFNGTIFAYGQTGSGKTYTMTGSTKKYQDRGIIPRSLQFIFSAIEKTEEKPTLYISYMEIYNEICYDLLNAKDSKTASRVEELPRVVVLEDKKGEARLRNLSVLPVSTEEEAMRLLFLGDTNRAIAETPLNEYSSRSHCIFTIYIKSRPNDTQTLRYSKLNLVDLAGSERVYKSNITGTILNEAKHINLSLHFLQQVILALSESKRVHIPYRNSFMTFILKDSLAGNCLTVMLATLAVSKRNMLETISTCKFAQRVSLIKTEPVINEVSDPYQEILLLKNEIQELRTQLANRSTLVFDLENQTLTNMQKEDCEKKLEEFLNSSEKPFKIELNAKILQHCFSLLKTKIQNLENKQVDVEHNGLQSNKTCSIENHERKTKNEVTPNDFIFALDEHSSLQKFMSNPENCEEINYYTKILSCTYQKAKILALAIEQCQASISYIREKLDIIVNTGCSKQKIVLGQELEHQQNIYRNSLVELKELKHETMQLEAGLKKAKARMMQRFNERVKATNKGETIIEMQKYQNLFRDDSSIFENNCGRVGFREPCDLVGGDFEPLQHQSCQCNEFSEHSDFVTRQYHPQYQNYCKKSPELSQDHLKYNCGLQGHYCNKVLSPVPNACCILDPHQTHQLQRKKSAIAFLPEINNNDKPVKKSTPKCLCDKIFFPQTENNLNRFYYDIDYSNVSDKNTIKQRTESTHCNQSCKYCDYRGRYYEGGSYSSSLLSGCKYESSQITPANLHLEVQPDIQCCCNKDNFSDSSHHFSGITKQLKFQQNASTVSRNLMEDDVFSIKRSNGDHSLNLNSISDSPKNNNAIKDGLSCSAAYLDTQFIPNKLDKEIPQEDSPAEFTSDEIKIITGSKPNCQEIPSRSCEISESYLTDDNIRLVNSETRKNETKESNTIQRKCMDIKKCQNKEYDIFLETDTEEFQTFMKSISLTGDEEIDKEICNFYRSKVCY